MSKQDEMRDAIIEVLERHGYEIPGVADLCAGAALRVMREPSPLQHDAMAAEFAAIRRKQQWDAPAVRDVYQAGIDAEIGAAQ